jgi:hypothetical protein
MKTFYLERYLSATKMLAVEIWDVYWTLLRIMVPALLAVKLLDTLGATVWLGWLLAPLMSLVGLPESMGLVWATAMLTNIYTGMAVFFSSQGGEALSIAQVTVLGTMMLLAHSLPIEGAVAKAAGVSWKATLLLRITGALLLGWLLHISYQYTHSLQAVNQLVWQPKIAEAGLRMWLKTQVELLIAVLVIIAVLMIGLRILRKLGIERLLHYLLSPVLRLLGISQQAANITVIGVTLGLSFGGGLLIKEARSGLLAKRDIILSLAFLGLCHSLIEDTLLILLLGADLSGILWARLAFAVVIVAILARLPWINRLPKSPVP